MKHLAALFVVCLPASVTLAQPLQKIHLVNDRAPDCSSLASIVDTVTRDCRTDDERAIAIYNFCRYACYHHAYPNEPGGISALKMIHVYGWGLCGGLHTVQASLWDAAGYPYRYRGWSNPGHTTVEVNYGGRWHYLDTFLKFYAWTPDPQASGGRTIASQADLLANPQLLADQFVMDPARKVCYHENNRFDYVGETVNWTAPAFLVCGDTLEGVASGVASSRDAGNPRGWGAIRFDDPEYSTDVNLPVGYSLTLAWSKQEDAFYFRGRDQGAYHTCGDKDYRNCPAIGPLLEPYREDAGRRSWSNGELVYRLDAQFPATMDGLIGRDNVVLRNGTFQPEDANRPAVMIAEMASPYVVAKASAAIRGGQAKLEVSPDQRNWTAVEAADFSQAVRGLYRYFVRITFAGALAGVDLTSVVQHNQEALPYLAPGLNKITIAAGNAAALQDRRLIVTYAWCPGWRERTPEQMFEQDAEIARAHFATWSAQPVVLQREVKQLPDAFEIPIATPRDRQPVYPRMLLLRREVLAAGQPPLEVPAAPSVPSVGPDEFLPAVPNPWRIGCGEPRTKDDRPTAEMLVPASRLSYVSKGGEVFEWQFIKWLKDNSEAWVLLADFALDELPEARSLAAARLVFYVHEAHDRAPMQAAAVELQAPFQTGRPYDFAKLGRTAGTTVVHRGDGPGAAFDPPRRYEIDVTRLVRGWARGEPQNGLALRIVPNRSVDDGWTVRFTPARDKPLELLIETYR